MKYAVLSGDVVTNAREIMADLSARLLTSEGRIKLLPAAEYQSIPHEHLMLFCNRMARYGIPTIELVEWLKERIDGRKAIEIGAGNGDLGYHLGITSTDSYIQQTPELLYNYCMTGQTPTDPPKDVVKADALTAIKRFKPQVVIGSWVTRKFVMGKDIDGKAQAFVFGTEDEKIIKNCQCYIHIGNEQSHGEKTALSLPHKVYSFSWLVSRSMSPEQNIIYQWGE